MGARLLYLVCGAILVLASATMRAQTPGSDAAGGFVTGVEDLPLIAGLIEDADAGLVFDKPSGRIVEAYAAGALARADVVAFYAQTLPELGWRHVDELAFVREGEALHIVIAGDDGAITVRFSLSPR